MSEELKPVKCGCGGEAKVDKHTYYRALPTYGVRCHRCGQETRQFYMNEAGAIQAWNKAMGERTAKVIEHDASITDTDGYKYLRTEYICGACKKKVIGGDEYCSHCGARLEWK